MNIKQSLSPAITAGGNSQNELLLRKKHASFLSRYSNQHSQKVVSGQLSFFAKHASKIGLDIRELTQDDISIYARNLRNEGLRNATYNARLSALKNYSQHLGITGLDFPFQKQESYSKVRIIAEKDFKRIVSYLRHGKDCPGVKQGKFMRDYLFFSLAFFTGMRKSEVLNLRHSDIFQDGDSWKYKATGKGRKEIVKDFPSVLIADLLTLKSLEKKDNEDYVFTSFYGQTKARLAANAYNRIINQYNRKVNGRTHPVTVHGIRNLSAFTLYRKTNDILKTQQHCNHSSLNTTHIYLSKLATNKIDYYDDMAEELQV